MIKHFYISILLFVELWTLQLLRFSLIPPCIDQVDVIDDAYVAAIGYLREDQGLSPAGQVRNILDCAREMLEVVRSISYPPSLGKMELRIGIHVGPVFAGVVGVKYPRYAFFGNTIRLVTALNRSTLPMTVHISEMAYNRVKVRISNVWRRGGDKGRNKLPSR
jgi:class 3 adenylate cyclase